MPRAIPWEDFAREYSGLYRQPMRARRTLQKLQGRIRELTALGVKSPRDLTPGLIARYIESKATLQHATLKCYVAMLRPLCAYAAKMGYCRVDPFAIRSDWVTAAEVDDEERDERDEAEHLTLDEIATLLEHTAGLVASWEGHRLHALVSLVAYTGLRKEEALRSKIVDYDFERRVVRVRRRRGKALKTGQKSAAPVGLPPALVPTLEGWFALTGCEWAFPRTDRLDWWAGGSHANCAFGRVVQAGIDAGLKKRVNFRVLRRSCGTHAEYFGLGQAMITRMLRHSKATTSRQFYQKADEANVAAAAERIDFRRHKAS